jgi:DNA repair protein RAD57
MTDLLSTVPDFSTAAYTHLIPSFEKNGITVADLLTLDPIEIVRRCPLPLLDVRRFIKEVIESLRRDAGVQDVPITKNEEFSLTQKLEDNCGIVRGFRKVVNNWNPISTLDDKIDEALGGGIPTGYVTEVTGER